MTPNLHSCSPTLFFRSPTLFSSTPKVFFHTPTLLSSSPKILFWNPDLHFCFPTLLSSTLLINSSTHETYKHDNNYRNNKNKYNTTNGQLLTHAYVHLLADVHSAGSAPAFTVSLCDSVAPANRRMPIASVVRRSCKKKDRHILI